MSVVTALLYTQHTKNTSAYAEVFFQDRKFTRQTRLVDLPLRLPDRS